MALVRSKRRIADHGEVFTPSWMVEAMLGLVKAESERIDSRFLEPACGSGNFVTDVLRRKLIAVELKYGKSDFEKRHYSLLGLMCIYGIELLEDNVSECRENMLNILADYLLIDEADDAHRAASFVLAQNIVRGDALTMLTSEGLPIMFSEWGYLGKGKFQRREFRLDTLTQMSSFGKNSHFADVGKHAIFTPVKRRASRTSRTTRCSRRPSSPRGCSTPSPTRGRPPMMERASGPTRLSGSSIR
jgi:hypothetical protein